MIGELLTTAEVSSLLRVPVATLRWWRHVGQGPASFTLGKSVRYERAEVERWYADERAASTSGARL